jgi:hypothetical protein
MKAKLILNEIKQNKDTALGAIGIGRTSLTYTYDYLQRYIQSLLNYADELDDIDGLPNIIKDDICEFLHATPENVMGLSDLSLLGERISGISSDFINFLEKHSKNLPNFNIAEYGIDSKRYFLKDPYVSKIKVLRLRTTNDKYSDFSELCYYFFMT